MPACTRAGNKGHDRTVEALPGLNTTLPLRAVYWIAGAGEDCQHLMAMESFDFDDDVKFLSKVPAVMIADL